MPKEWTIDQIRQFQDYFDALMSGNLGRRRMVKFMPAEFKLTETHQPPLKDQYDEWLARIICYAFSVPASAFVSQFNRASPETLRMQATQEGLAPLKGLIETASVTTGPAASFRRTPTNAFQGATQKQPRSETHPRHCERSEAIQRVQRLDRFDCFAALAMTGGREAR